MVKKMAGERGSEKTHKEVNKRAGKGVPQNGWKIIRRMYPRQKTNEKKHTNMITTTTIINNNNYYDKIHEEVWEMGLWEEKDRRRWAEEGREENNKKKSVIDH